VSELSINDPFYNFYNFCTKTCDAMKLLQKEGFVIQGLVVLYSAIDTMAWANLPSGDVTRSAFKEWIDHYMLCKYPLPCTSEELYAARCGLVHSHTAESKMSREQNVREIYYYGKGTSKELLESKVGGRSDVIQVRLLDLQMSFFAGIDAFFELLDSDPSRAEQVRNRTRLWMSWFDSH